MLRALATTVLVAAILAMAGLSFEMSHFISNKAVWYAIIAPQLLAIGFIPVWAAQGAKRRKIDRTQRLAAYKASPESHILRLND
jgi:hypothetical protein